MNCKHIRYLLTGAFIALGSSLSYASGSEAGGGAETGDAHAYNMGKGVYAQKLACKTCPLAGKTLDGAMARELLSGSSVVPLDDMEKEALTVYLSRRFKL